MEVDAVLLQLSNEGLILAETFDEIFDDFVIKFIHLRRNHLALTELLY